MTLWDYLSVIQQKVVDHKEVESLLLPKFIMTITSQGETKVFTSEKVGLEGVGGEREIPLPCGI